jgi:hypothetical protein
MPDHTLARNARVRAIRVFGSLTVATLAAGCALPSNPTGVAPQPIYAVLYGHVTAPTGRTEINLEGRVYNDSLSAVAFAKGTGYVGGFSMETDGSNNYITFLAVSTSGTYYITELALGQGTTGVVYSTDTAYAVRFRFDSLGGGPHDSIAVNLNLP